MTRKRTRESLGRRCYEPCFYCDGTGQLQSKADDRLRDPARRSAASATRSPGYSIVVNAHPAVVDCSTATRQARVAGGREPLHAPDRASCRARSTTSSSSTCKGSEACRRRATRRHKRARERVTINKEFESFDAFIQEYVTNISRTGVFIQAQTPAARRHRGEPPLHRDHGRHRDDRRRRRGRARARRPAGHGRRLHAHQPPLAAPAAERLLTRVAGQARGSLIVRSAADLDIAALIEHRRARRRSRCRRAHSC